MKYLLAALAALSLLFSPSCASGPKTQLDTMSLTEYESLERRVAAWTRVGSWALVAKDKMQADDMQGIARVLEVLASGDVSEFASSVLTHEFTQEGWDSAALMLLLAEADLLLEARGVWGDPGQRWRALLKAAAAAVREGAAIPEEDKALAESVDEEIAGLE